MRDHRELLSRAEGCWTFDARDRMPRSSRLPVHAITAVPENPPASTPPSRESGFVLGWICAIPDLPAYDADLEKQTFINRRRGSPRDGGSQSCRLTHRQAQARD